MIRWLTARLAEARVSVMFLTALPSGEVSGVIPISRTAWAWPLVGALLGVIFTLAYWAASAASQSHEISATLAVIAGLLASGALHEDGLADLADGIGGGSDPKRRLEIMRDSRLGSYGAIALIVTLSLTILLWSDLPRDSVLPAALSVGAISRMALPMWLSQFPTARVDGLGLLASQDIGGASITAAIAIGSIIAFLMLPPVIAVFAISACLTAQLATCLYALSRLGGITGDVMGAAQIIGSLASLLTLAAG